MCVHVFDSVHVVHKSIISSIVQLIFIGLATPTYVSTYNQSDLVIIMHFAGVFFWHIS